MRILKAARGAVDDALDAHAAALDDGECSADAISTAARQLAQLKRKALEAGLISGLERAAAGARNEDQEALAELHGLPQVLAHRGGQ